MNDAQTKTPNATTALEVGRNSSPSPSLFFSFICLLIDLSFFLSFPHSVQALTTAPSLRLTSTATSWMRNNVAHRRRARIRVNLFLSALNSTRCSYIHVTSFWRVWLVAIKVVVAVVVMFGKNFDNCLVLFF